MKIKQSIYNIFIDLEDGKVLLYNTGNTAMIVLEKKLKTEIFDEMYYTKHLTETEALFEEGFLVNQDIDEFEEQRKLIDLSENEDVNLISNITISPTNSCNARCFYCYENLLKNKNTMTQETVNHLCSFLEKNVNREKELKIVWHGGEPLLAKNIITEISTFLHNKGIKFYSTMNTNGLLFDNDTIDIAKNLWNIKKIQITIDAIGQKYNDIKNYKGDVKNAFNIVTKNIFNLINSNIVVVNRVNFTFDKVDETLSIIHWLLDHYGKLNNYSVYPAPIFGSENGNYNSDDIKRPMQKLYRELFLINLFGFDKKWPLLPRIISCFAKKSNYFYIAPSGKFYKCQHNETFLPNSSVGDVKNGVIKNKTYWEWCENDYTLKECRACAFFPICHGGCKSAVCGESRSPCLHIKPIIDDFIFYAYKFTKEVL